MLYHFEPFSFDIFSVGHVMHKKGTYSVEARPYSAFSLRIAGDATFFCDGVRTLSSVGDITFIPAGMPYEAVYSDGESIFVHLTGCNYHAFENIATESLAYSRQKFEEMAEAWSFHRVYAVKSIFYHILALLAEREHGARKEGGFRECLRYMEMHFASHSITLGDVARAGFMSEATLRRKFHEVLGRSPKEHLLKLRLTRGITLLGEGMAVKDAAFACGFSDEKFFSRTVKKQYGAPPSAFRSL